MLSIRRECHIFDFIVWVRKFSWYITYLALNVVNFMTYGKYFHFDYFLNINIALVFAIIHHRR